ncbi:MAG: glutamine synthetase III [Kiritimatiellae bacterium]|nr:glutamine synthetase III [Kiritimatiellia bacterium]
MSHFARQESIETIARRPVPPPYPAQAAGDIAYAEDVFTRETMREYLPKEICRKILATIDNGEPLDASVAGDVAHAMRQWAMDRGATHYTHWFLPLTGSTAEKHDAFLELKDGKPIQSFSGKNLIVGEPDASSFPSGGLRSTFEARGYTAWDPTSPAFVKRNGNGATLCIPTAFCAYTGEALDKKTPLLRSMQALTNATRRLMRCFGAKGDGRVAVSLGAEQEYFLVDKSFYLQRPDLLQAGRTLFGAASAKHQQLEDHYFGSIKPRVLDFMTEVERELWRLGIPAKTRHNEVAPAQFELAPIHEELNLACDHNMLVMEVLRTVADRHGLVCLLHEKPFAGVNGSGKHNNWSLAYDGRNLLDPGSDPRQNAIFLTVLCSVIAAVDRRADLLRASVASAGNDHRLGANEAPPAILSVYLGAQLAEILSQLEQGREGRSADGQATALKIGVDVLPALPKDTTDRNRTSPFAFTGNKFEFRAPGASFSCAGPNTVLNTVVAEAFDEVAEELEKAPAGRFNPTLQGVLRKLVKAHKRVLFNGDGYTGEWAEEAARRGLPNAPTTPEALEALVRPENVALFERYGVMNAREMESRHEIGIEDYRRKVAIEGNCALDMATSMIVPAVRREYRKALETLDLARRAESEPGAAALDAECALLGEGLADLQSYAVALTDALDRGDTAGILEAMGNLRCVADHLEPFVEDDRWPLPKYREMLFVY